MTCVGCLERYLDKRRTQLVSERDDRLMFLAYTGQPLSLHLFTPCVAGYGDAANIGNRGYVISSAPGGHADA